MALANYVCLYGWTPGWERQGRVDRGTRMAAAIAPPAPAHDREMLLASRTPLSP